MTPRVWIERPITSVEDAEALPEGTPAIDGYDFVRERCISGWTGGNGERLYSHADMIGWTALLPVEAEEETRYAYAVRDDWVGDERVTRLVTPWEDV